VAKANVHPERNVNLVVVCKVKHCLWVGAVPSEMRQKLDKNISHRMHFGHHEQIYDRFKVDSTSGISFPSDIPHLLAQLPTSRYMHCPTQRKQWLTQNNIAKSDRIISSFEQSIVSMKKLMKRLSMEFWIVCGTLLGWYRQCGITPYTTD